MIREAIAAVVDGASLTIEEAAGVMEEIMAGEATPAQIGAFVTALRLKGETSEEIAGMAQVMRTNGIKVEYPEPLVDIVGTGGDSLNTFNISTASALVLAASGVKVAKHGARAASSVAGSADVLEACGVKLELAPEEVVRSSRQPEERRASPRDRPSSESTAHDHGPEFQEDRRARRSYRPGTGPSSS